MEALTRLKEKVQKLKDDYSLLKEENQTLKDMLVTKDDSAQELREFQEQSALKELEIENIIKQVETLLDS